MMKKQYILALLLLVGFGIVSTMAFTYDGALTIDQEAYGVSNAGATGNITRVKAIPLGDLDKVKFTVTLTGQSVAYDMYVDLVGVGNLTGAVITVSAGTVGTNDLATGHFEYTNIASGSSWTITIDATGITYPGVTVWQDITSVFITIGDYA